MLSFHHFSNCFFPNFCAIRRFQLRHGNALPVLLNGTLNGIVALAVVFIACELGQRLSDAFEKISLIVNRFGWYLFPIEMKRLLPMIIKISQQSVELECFGSISCTRDVFKNVSIKEKRPSFK